MYGYLGVQKYVFLRIYNINMYNILTNNAVCHQAIADTVPLAMVYYAHIPTMIISLLVGFFVFLKDKKSLPNILLFALSLTYSFWLIGDLIAWVMNYNTILTMATWSLLGLLNVLFFILSLYFVYVYIDKKDISLGIKIIMGLILLPVIILAPTKMNLSGFTMSTCEAIEQQTFLDIVLYSEIFISAWIILLSIWRYIKADKENRRQILLLSAGMVLFLVSFFIAGYYASYIDDFRYELYGLFGMTFFMGVLAYLIVKFKAFNIKLLSAQAIIAALLILIASQFVFIQNNTNRILTGITLMMAVVFGYFLIKSVKKEVAQREELEIANEKLKKLDQAKSEFISIASHQLRTPLTVIKGYISMILDGNFGELTPGEKDALDKVYVSNERLINLVESLLNISRIESGRLQLNFENKQLEDLVASVCDELEHHAEKKGLNFTFTAPKTKLPPVRMDEEKMRQVVMNLVDNSIKYTPKGSVTVTLKKTVDKLLFCVSDSGIGVRAEDMPNLFKKFSRGTGTSLIHTEGTGLGLYVVKQMIEVHGGRAWIESEGEMKGSKFYFEMPFVK